MRYSYTQVALFALTASALPTNLKRDPQILGGLVDAGYDLADAAGSLASPFVDAGASIIGGVASGAADVAGGVASGLFGYKEKRDPQLLGSLLDAGYDVADAAGSIVSPFVDAGASIIGGVASGAADVVGGVASGVLGYKEKRDPQILGNLIGAGIDAGRDAVGNIASIPGDVLDALTGGYGYDEDYKVKRDPQILGHLIGAGIDAGRDAVGNIASIPGDVLDALTGGYGYDDDYKKSKRSPQLLSDLFDDGEDIVEEVAEEVTTGEFRKRSPEPQLLGGIASATGDVLHAGGSVLSSAVGSGATVVGGLASGVGSIAGGVYDALLGGYGKDEYKVKRDPQGLVGSLVGGLANTVDSLLGGGYGYEYDGDRYDGPDVVVVAPPNEPPVIVEGGEYKAKRDPQLLGSLVGGLTNTVDSLLGGHRGYGYEHDGDRYDGPDVVVVAPQSAPPVVVEGGYEWRA